MVAPDRDIAQAAGFIAPPGYSRRWSETTLLYRLVAEHYPKFRDRRVAEGRALPRYVEDEFERRPGAICRSDRRTTTRATMPRRAGLGRVLACDHALPARAGISGEKAKIRTPEGRG